MQDLRVYFFGGPEIYRDGSLLPVFPTQKSLSLFAYLIVNRGRLIHRDTLCGQFWSEHTDVEARKALRTCLWRIRSVVEPRKEQRGTLLQVQGSRVRFIGTATTWVDVWEFEDAVKLVSGAQAADPEWTLGLERAAALYRADFLEGVDDEWCFLHRERLRLAYFTALERLVAHHGIEGRWLDVITRGRQILREDPLREHIHRAVIEAHLAMGDRPSALRQYESCVRTLEAELEVEPMEETRQLYEQAIRRPTPVMRGISSELDRSREGVHVEGLVAEVDGVLAALYSLLDRLERARGALGGNEVWTAATHPLTLTFSSARGGRRQEYVAGTLK